MASPSSFVITLIVELERCLCQETKATMHRVHVLKRSNVTVPLHKQEPSAPLHYA
jgi:hypothetical protein